MICDVKGKTPQVDLKNSFIAETAAVIGNVTLGAQSSIWFGVVLRGDIEPVEIGERSNIQDNSVAHTSHNFPVKVGRGVTVGHQVTLHGCTVGDNCLIGIKATLLDGSVVGDNCLIGAGSLVKQNQQIPAGSLAIGAPARVIRKLTEAEIANLKTFADRYVELLKEYL